MESLSAHNIGRWYKKRGNYDFDVIKKKLKFSFLKIFIKLVMVILA